MVRLKARRNLYSLRLNGRPLIFEQSLICLPNLQRGCRHKKFELNEESLKKAHFPKRLRSAIVLFILCTLQILHNGLKPFLKKYSFIETKNSENNSFLKSMEI